MGRHQQTAHFGIRERQLIDQKGRRGSKIAAIDIVDEDSEREQQHHSMGQLRAATQAFTGPAMLLMTVIFTIVAKMSSSTVPIVACAPRSPVTTERILVDRPAERSPSLAANTHKQQIAKA
jgi:hypothetical protein